MLTHIVRQNDKVNTITDYYNIDRNELMNNNRHITKWDKLIPGTKLRIPIISNAVDDEIRETEPFIEEYYPETDYEYKMNSDVQKENVENNDFSYSQQQEMPIQPSPQDQLIPYQNYQQNNQPPYQNYQQNNQPPYQNYQQYNQPSYPIYQQPQQMPYPIHQTPIYYQNSPYNNQQQYIHQQYPMQQPVYNNSGNNIAYPEYYQYRYNQYYN